MLRADQFKKIGAWRLWLISALIPLSFFFTGSIDPAKNIEGPGLMVPANGQVRLNTGPLPGWWQKLDLRIRCEPGQDCASLRAAGHPTKSGQRPIRGNKNEVVFRLQTNNPQAPELALINPGNRALVIQKVDLRNYSSINTGFPRFAVLLSPFPGPGFSLFTVSLLTLGSAFLLVLSLIFLRRREQNRWTRGFLWMQLLFPCLILSLALALRLKNVYLVISWEALLFIPFLGYLFLGFTSRLFRKSLWVPFLIALIIATFLVFLGTVLGVGIPVRNFGPYFIYHTHFTRSAHIAGLFYLVLSVMLYRHKKEWFSPDRHLFLSSIWIVFLPLLIVYLANGYSDYGGDTTFNSLLPWKIIQGEGLFFSKTYVNANGSWGLSEVGDAFLPNFPMGPSFFGLPTALIQYFWSTEPVFRLIAWNQKVTAVWIAALSAAVVYQMVYLISRKPRLSLLLSAAFALGTSQLNISAAVIWQHGPAVLLICLGLFFLIKGQEENPKYFPLAALPLAFLPLVRTQAVLFYLSGLASVAILQPKMIIRFFLWSLPGIGATLWINLGLYHAILGGYAYQASGDNFATPFLEGAIGSLFSPNRGLLIFSPFLIMGVIGGGILWAKRSVIALAFGPAVLLYFVVHAKYANWHGGWCVAPRFSCELIPVLVFFSIYWFLEIKRSIARLTGWMLIIISIAINLPGFFFMHEQVMWNNFPSLDYYLQERVWDYKDWLPVHFRYFVRLENYKEVPAFAFANNEPDQPLKSKEYHFRVKTALGENPIEVMKMRNVSLKEGSYRIIFKGDSQNSDGATAAIILEFIGHKTEELAIPINRQPSFGLTHLFEMKITGKVDIHLKVSGRGTLIWDTVQIVPVDKTLLNG